MVAGRDLRPTQQQQRIGLVGGGGYGFGRCGLRLAEVALGEQDLGADGMGEAVAGVVAHGVVGQSGGVLVVADAEVGERGERQIAGIARAGLEGERSLVGGLLVASLANQSQQRRIDGGGCGHGFVSTDPTLIAARALRPSPRW